VDISSPELELCHLNPLVSLFSLKLFQHLKDRILSYLLVCEEGFFTDKGFLGGITARSYELLKQDPLELCPNCSPVGVSGVVVHVVL
jgi:hypothetical protein